jgi:pimeloyl-ACP methyl ester carboxylesterase
MSEPESRFFESTRMRLHYVDWGNEDAPPLILMHGGRDHARSWDWVARALSGDFHIVAPDLRGHGDSDWAPDGHYSVLAHMQDLAELVDQLALAPVAIIAHSFGGAISLRYAGIFPDHVRRLVAIEGVGGPPHMVADYDRTPIEERIAGWINDTRRLAGRPPRLYPTLENAEQRMREENSRLSAEQVRHLVVHGTRRNEDGSYSWKFDNLVRTVSPIELTARQREELWERITCPVLLINGTDSWATNPAEEGRLKHFRNARVSVFEGAGHWVHHDQLDRFVSEVRAFLTG